MNRYIDAEVYKEELSGRQNMPDAQHLSFYLGVQMAIDLVDRVPEIELAPVIHAHWTIIYESTAGVTDAKCSNCGYESLAYENDAHTDENCNYCPCCGAKMDEEVKTYE